MHLDQRVKPAIDGSLFHSWHPAVLLPPRNILARTLTVQLCTAWQSTSFCWNWLPGYFSGCHFHTISPSSFVLYHLRYCRTLLFLPSPKQLWAEGIYLISVTLSRNSPTLQQGPLIHPHSFSAYSAFPKWVTRTSHSISGPDEKSDRAKSGKWPFSNTGGIQCSSRRDCPKPELCGQGQLVGLLCDNKITFQNKTKFNRNICFKGHKIKRFLYGNTEAPFHIFTAGLASISEDMASRMIMKCWQGLSHVDSQVTPHLFLWRVSPTLTSALTFPALEVVGLTFSSDHRDQELLDKYQ